MDSSRGILSGTMDRFKMVNKLNFQSWVYPLYLKCQAYSSFCRFLRPNQVVEWLPLWHPLWLSSYSYISWLSSSQNILIENSCMWFCLCWDACKIIYLGPASPLQTCQYIMSKVLKCIQWIIVCSCENEPCVLYSHVIRLSAGNGLFKTSKY